MKAASSMSAVTIPIASYEVEQGQFRIKGYDGPVIECDKCGSDMQLKTGRRQILRCSESSCTNTRAPA